MLLSISSIVLLNNLIQKEPFIIIRPIMWILGLALNLFYNFVYIFTTPHSLGLSIILLTIFARILMLPLAFKQQRMMFNMQKIQPEIKKIQDKYKNSSDPEAQKKMGIEMQKLYAKHNYNPFSGCLPMLIQLPIFIALYYIMQNSYQFIDVIGQLFNDISEVILNTPNFIEIVRPLAVDKVPNGMRIDIAQIADLEKVLNKFTVSDWATLKQAIPALDSLLANKASIEYFFGMNLTEKVGFTFPKIIIPIFSGLTTYFSSWLMTRKTASTDKAMQTQQKVMNITMPLFMAYITSTLPGGVGVYWITSNLFQIVQQIFLNKKFDSEKEEKVKIEENKEKVKGKKKGE